MISMSDVPIAPVAPKTITFDTVVDMILDCFAV
jgi:hypothetical protein